MGFERVAIFGLIDLDLDSTTGGSITLSTDLPGNAMAIRETKGIPTVGRRVVRFRLQGTTKGRLYAVRVTPAGIGVIHLYGGRIWARVLPGTEWQWYALPIPTTGDWAPVKLDIPETGPWQPSKLPVPLTGDWEPSKLPIPPTDDWQPAKLPIPPTNDWAPSPLPIAPTPQNPEWIPLEMDS